MTSINSIPGYNVTKIGKDKYAVSVNNGNMGAVILNKSQVKQLADIYGAPAKKEKSTAKKVLTGLAVVAGVALTAFVLHKKGVVDFKGLYNKVETAFSGVKEKITKKAEPIKQKIVENAENVKKNVNKNMDPIKEKFAENAEKLKNKMNIDPDSIKKNVKGFGQKAKDLYNNIAKGAKKVWETVKEFVIGVWNKIFKKGSADPQQKIPFPNN